MIMYNPKSCPFDQIRDVHKQDEKFTIKVCSRWYTIEYTFNEEFQITWSADNYGIHKYLDSPECPWDDFGYSKGRNFLMKSIDLWCANNVGMKLEDFLKTLL